ncbi:MAG: glycosyltransferase family 2 protein [Clostridiales bacterium]|jgi:teichuronic acid biosynthesis glycosyltransferase TuaG|nr:glycosyltransferase family 2 protein [Clostridiales bacterium]
MMKPDISVIIPVYNGQRFIADAVNSVLSQIGVNLEALVIDDCSDDETSEIVNSLADNDDRVIYIRTLSNQGVAGARNTGVEAASGDWAAFLDADDKWHNDKLFRQCELIQQYEQIGKYPPLCYTGAYVMNDDGSFAGRVLKAPSRVTSQELLFGNVIIASTVMVRRRLLLEHPFEHGDLHEDYIEWFRILDKYGPGVGVRQPLARYRLTNGSKSRNKLRSARMAWRTYKYLGLSTPRALVSFAYYVRHGLRRYVF